MKVSAQKIEQKNDKLIIIDTNGKIHVVDRIKEQEGQFTILNWKCEDDVVSQFDGDSQEAIIDALEQTTESEYFA